MVYLLYIKRKWVSFLEEYKRDKIDKKKIVRAKDVPEEVLAVARAKQTVIEGWVEKRK